MACTAMATSPWPVTRISGSSRSMSASRVSSCRPSLPGMRTSLTTTPAKSLPSSGSASATLAQTRTGMPDSSSHWRTAWRMAASSSMKSTCSFIRSLIRLALVIAIRHGQTQGEHRPLGAVSRLQAAAQVAQDAVGNRQPQPQPLAYRFGGEEGIEQAGEMLGGNAAAVVLDRQGPAARLAPAADAEPRRVPVGTGVQGIVQQVEQDLLDANHVTEHVGVRVHGQFQAHRAGAQAR